MSNEQPNSDLLNPYCQHCKGSKEIIHVITHECLEGDALRCVIKGVPDDAPLDPDDYVKVSDLLEYLQGSINVPSGSATSAIDAPATISPTAVAPVNTPAPSSVAVSSDIALPNGVSVVTITATAGMSFDDHDDRFPNQSVDDGSTTITTTATVQVATSAVESSNTPAGYVSSASGTLSSSDSLSSLPSTLVSSSVSTPIRSDSSSPSVTAPATISSPTETPSITTTVVQSTVTCKKQCTTLYQTSFITIAPTPSNGAYVPSPFPGAFSQTPNSRTVYAPPGGWPFQRIRTLTSSDSPTATPSVDSARINRIVRPAGRPVGNRIADGRVKDAPMAKMLHGGVFRRDEEDDETDTDGEPEDQTPRFSMADLFYKHKAADLHLPQIARREHKNEARSDIKISEDIARVILNADETLNPNSTLLHKLRPHLAVSPRELPFATKSNAADYTATGTLDIHPYKARETHFSTPQQYYDRIESAIARPATHFHVASPYDKAILGLLCVVVVGMIGGGFVTMIVKKSKSKPFSRV